MLDGFWARKQDGHPGAKVLADGMRVLQAIVWYNKQTEAADRRPKGRTDGKPLRSENPREP